MDDIKLALLGDRTPILSAEEMEMKRLEALYDKDV